MTSRPTAAGPDPATSPPETVTAVCDRYPGPEPAGPEPVGHRGPPPPAGSVTEESRVALGTAEPLFHIVTREEAGTRVLDCVGRMDATSLPACASALAACLPPRPVWIVADLRETELGPESLALLTLMQRYIARGGAQFVMVSTDPDLLQILRDADSPGPYRIGPTVQLAIGAPERSLRRDRFNRP